MANPAINAPGAPVPHMVIQNFADLVRNADPQQLAQLLGDVFARALANVGAAAGAVAGGAANLAGGVAAGGAAAVPAVAPAVPVAAAATTAAAAQAAGIGAQFFSIVTTVGNNIYALGAALYPTTWQKAVGEVVAAGYIVGTSKEVLPQSVQDAFYNTIGHQVGKATVGVSAITHPLAVSVGEKVGEGVTDVAFSAGLSIAQGALSGLTRAANKVVPNGGQVSTLTDDIFSFIGSIGSSAGNSTAVPEAVVADTSNGGWVTPILFTATVLSCAGLAAYRAYSISKLETDAKVQEAAKEALPVNS